MINLPVINKMMVFYKGCGRLKRPPGGQYVTAKDFLTSLTMEAKKRVLSLQVLDEAIDGVIQHQFVQFISDIRIIEHFNRDKSVHDGPERMVF